MRKTEDVLQGEANGSLESVSCPRTLSCRVFSRGSPCPNMSATVADSRGLSAGDVSQGQKKEAGPQRTPRHQYLSCPLTSEMDTHCAWPLCAWHRANACLGYHGERMFTPVSAQGANRSSCRGPGGEHSSHLRGSHSSPGSRRDQEYNPTIRAVQQLVIA